MGLKLIEGRSSRSVSSSSEAGSDEDGVEEGGIKDAPDGPDGDQRTSRCCATDTQWRWGRCVGCCWCLVTTYVVMSLVVYLGSHFIMYPGTFSTDGGAGVGAGLINRAEHPEGCSEFTFKSHRAGRTLKGYRCRKGTALRRRPVICFGGNNMHMWHSMFLAEMLVPKLDGKELEIYSFSYPGYPPNAGWTDEYGTLDDAAGLLDYVRQNSTAEPPVIVGWSLGTAVTIGTAERAAAGDVACIVVGNPFTTMRRMVAKVTGGALILWSWVIDYWPSVHRAKTLKVPILVLSGINDELIPNKMHRQIYDAVPGNRKMILTNPSDHNNVAVWPVRHKAEITTYFEQWCRPA